MKKLVLLMLVFVLAACATPAAPTEQPAAPAPAEPVVVTVVVEATQPPAAAPTQEPAQPIVVTVVVEATQPPAAAPTAAPAQPAASDGTVALDNALGRGVFTNMTMSSSNLTLRCAPRDITFNITTPNGDINDVVFYYRMTDAKRLYPSEWKAFGNMVANGNGNFTLTFSGESVHPDIRVDGGWFDFQFVGLAKSGNVIDRSDQFNSLVKYTFDCP
jgi:hypothetical protein